ncbi:MAG: RIP metalloprotease RseP [Bacteroidaceae bacterium]|nr:RIP metalloprotease RseP [Bacteroidaceae bacterium]
METILIKTLQFLLSLSLLVALHEGGHFLFAKLFKTRVSRFYLFANWGFHIFSTYDDWFRKLCHKPLITERGNEGQNFFQWVKNQYFALTGQKDKIKTEKIGNKVYKPEHGTEYGIGWLPIGGYVSILGMIDENNQKLSSEPQPWEFRSKPAWQRLLIMLGGVLMNFLVAFIIYAGVLYTWGESYVKTTDMTYGMKFNEQAKADGFCDGDLILGVDDQTFDDWNVNHLRDLSNANVAHVQRDGKRLDITLSGEMNLLEMLDEPRYIDVLVPLNIDSILPESPAERIGLKPGDLIVGINDEVINDFNDLQQKLAVLRNSVNESSMHADSLRARTIRLNIEGHAAPDTTLLTPDFTLGFVNKMPDYKVTTREYGLLESIPAGVSYAGNILGGYVNDLKYIFTKKGARSVGGFVTIGNIFPAEWDWYKFWMLTALLSIILGFMNVLPIPALDGGHALFALYEIVTGRKPSDKFLERAQYVGMFLLLALLIFANLNDILRLFGI